MTVTRFIGDVHGKYRQYKRIISTCMNSVQVGDMGVGFFRHDNGSPVQNPPHYAMKRGGHRFIRGNHDNPRQCKHHSQCIADGTVEGDVMFVGGALSVDREHRREGYSWWPDEELDIAGLTRIVDDYIKHRPRIMVTHDCPEEVALRMGALSGRDKIIYPSRTRQAFQSMWEIHQPELWVFGHWHHSFDSQIFGTRFICLAELEAKDIEI